MDVKIQPRFKKADTKIPHNIQEANLMLGFVGKSEEFLIALQEEMRDEIEAVKNKYKEQIEAATNARNVAFNKLFIFAQPRRQSLIQKVKTLFWSNGKIGWRFTTKRVVAEIADQDLIDKLEEMGLQKYVRVIKEVNREALLKDEPSIPSVKYSQHEEFFAKPKITTKEKLVTKTITKII